MNIIDKLKHIWNYSKYLNKSEQTKLKSVLTPYEFDYWCKDLIADILSNGKDSVDRTGIGTKSLFGYSVAIDVSKSIPITTLKSTPYINTIRELLWFLNGSSDVNKLHSRVKHWWTPWQKDDGNIGDMYGYMLRHYRITCFDSTSGEDTYISEADQFKNLVDGLIHNPHSRRHVITLWNPDLDRMALANCHGTVIQFYVDKHNKLNLYTHQRSMDLMLGGFVNFTSYAILLHIVAKLTGYSPNIMTYSMGDVHIYNNHIEGAREVLNRTPIDCKRELIIDPELTFEYLEYDLSLTGDSLDKAIDKIVDKFTLLDYKCHANIKLDIAV